MLYYVLGLTANFSSGVPEGGGEVALAKAVEYSPLFQSNQME
jgi:hypothetical protein